MRRVVVLAVVCALTSVAVARAGDASRRELAEQLLGAMQMQKTIEESFAVVKQMIPAQMQQAGAGDGASAAKAKERMESTMALVMEEMSWDKLKDDYIAIYADTFTEIELKGALAFYQSVVGRKFVEKQPELMRRSMQVSQKQMATLMPRIQQLTKEGMAPGVAPPTE